MAGHRRIRSPQGTGANGSVEVAARLAELVDVTITSAVAGDYLRHNGTVWVDVGAAQLVTDINALLVHNTLSGLTTGDPHTQYALLAGRSGGQTLQGGTGNGDDLALKTTGDGATKGDFIFEGAFKLAVGTESASFAHASGSGAYVYMRGQDASPTSGGVGGALFYKPGAGDGAGDDGFFGVAASDGSNLLWFKVGKSSGNITIATTAGDILLQPAGGNVRVYDTAPTNYLDLSHNGTDGVIATNTGDLQLNPATGFVGINKSSPGFPLDVATTVTNTARFYTTNNNSNGVSIYIIQDSSSPAANDKTGTFYFLADDNGGTQRVVARIAVQQDDVTSTTLDSSMLFSTQSAVNAGDWNTTATLTSLGVWTDASAEEGKTFEGVIPDVLDRLKSLRVEQYRSRHVSGAKVANAERHCSPSAEGFWDAFALGVDPRQVHEDQDGNKFKKAGIAPKDLAGVALLGLKELLARVEALEALVG